MKKIRLLITAGPTYEPIDPVRVITNRSTGLLGYEIAKEALKRSLNVTLISGPTFLKPPGRLKFIKVTEAIQMKREVLKEFKKADCLIMAAAVADFRVRDIKSKKIKKKKKFSLFLLENPDILKSLSNRSNKIVIGFALESENLLSNARKKLIDKRLDLIIANKINRNNTPFGEGRKDFVFLTRNKPPLYFRKKTKKEIAGAILKRVLNLYE